MKLKQLHLFKVQRSHLAAVFFVGLLFSACKKDTGDLGLLVQPPGDALNGTLVDTFSIISYSVVEDSLRTDELSNNLLGSYIDPVFGSMKADFYTQVMLSSNNPIFDVPNTVVDSVVLSLVYQTYYGDVSAQEFHVYELSDTLFKDSTYYSHHTKNVVATDLVIPGNTIQTPNYSSYFHDAITGDSTKPQLRLPLDISIGNRIINESGMGNLIDNSTFVKWFKGLYITVDNVSQSTGQGSVISMDVLNAASRITIYYHDLVDTTVYYLNINENCARFTHFEHDYSGTAIATQLSDSTLGQNYTYLQAGSGLKVNFKFPHLMSLANQGNIIINKAELKIPVQYFSLDPYQPVPRAVLFSYNADGTVSILQDQFEGDLVFGGYYDDVNKNYVFSIGRYLQDVFSGSKENLGLQLNAIGSAVSVYRSILSGASADNRNKPVLKIIYTKY